MIVVVFQPYGMSAFLHLPISLFYNCEISGYNLGDKGLEKLSARIFSCEDNAVCISHIEEWLVSRMVENGSGIRDKLRRIDAAMQRIYVAPQTSVTELSSIACLSRKQFERLFSALVGINPKEYTRIVRFQKALALMQCQFGVVINQAEIAYASGYADQSHFIREFKQFCGYTPVSLLKISEPYSDLFTHPI